MKVVAQRDLTPYPVSPDSDYYTTLQVDGCPRYLPGDKKDVPDKALVPTYSLERIMFGLIDDRAISKLRERLGNTQACWYETPGSKYGWKSETCAGSRSR